VPLWLEGPADIAAFLSQGPLAGDARGRFRAIPTTASGQPACALYTASVRPGVHAPSAIHVLSLDATGRRVRAVEAFLVPDLFRRFPLPAELSPHR